MSDDASRVSDDEVSSFDLITEKEDRRGHIADLVQTIKETADKLLRDQCNRGDVKLLSTALRELRYAFKVFSPYRRKRKVTVFGSARTQPDEPAYLHFADGTIVRAGNNTAGGSIFLISDLNNDGLGNLIVGNNAQILTRGNIVLDANPDGTGAGGFCDFGLLWRDHIHDDAAFEHLRKRFLDPFRYDLGIVLLFLL